MFPKNENNSDTENKKIDKISLVENIVDSIHKDIIDIIEKIEETEKL